MDNYQVPDLTAFPLKAYVSVHTPKVDRDVLATLRGLNDFNDPANFERFQQIE